MVAVFIGIALAGIILDFWWIAGALLIAGAGIAPALAVMFAIVSSSVKFSDTAEAYGWMGSGQLTGAALGSAVAGFAVDGFGPVGGFVAASIFAFIGMVIRRPLQDVTCPICAAAMPHRSLTPSR